MAETKLDQQQRATLSMTLAESSISETQLRTMLKSAKVHVRSVSVVRRLPERQEKFECDVRWHAHKDSTENPAVLKDIAQLPGLVEMSWFPAGTSQT
jgi:hypothetical protein